MSKFILEELLSHLDRFGPAWKFTCAKDVERLYGFFCQQFDVQPVKLITTRKSLIEQTASELFPGRFLFAKMTVKFGSKVMKTNCMAHIPSIEDREYLRLPFNGLLQHMVVVEKECKYIKRGKATGWVRSFYNHIKNELEKDMVSSISELESILPGHLKETWTAFNNQRPEIIKEEFSGNAGALSGLHSEDEISDVAIPAAVSSSKQTATKLHPVLGCIKGTEVSFFKANDRYSFTIKLGGMQVFGKLMSPTMAEGCLTSGNHPELRHTVYEAFVKEKNAAVMEASRLEDYVTTAFSGLNYTRCSAPLWDNFKCEGAPLDMFMNVEWDEKMKWPKSLILLDGGTMFGAKVEKAKISAKSNAPVWVAYLGYE